MPRVLIGICSLIYLLDGLLHSILGPLAPEIAGELGLTNAQLGPIFSANLLGQCIGLVAVPMLAARMSQRTVVLLALLGFGLAQAATALAQGATSLFVWRLITGLFLGGALPSCLALVTAAAPVERRGFAIMVLFTGYGLGATLAGVVATAFAGFGGWRVAMLAAGLACLATAVLGALYLRDPAAGDGKSAEAAAGWSGPLQIVSRPYLVGTLMLWLLFIAMLTISYCLTSWLPTLLVEVGRDRQFAALSISIFSLGGIIAALGVGLLIDRWGATRTLVSFLCLAAVLLFAVGQVLCNSVGRRADDAAGTVRILRAGRVWWHQRCAGNVLSRQHPRDGHWLGEEHWPHRHAGGPRADRIRADPRHGRNLDHVAVRGARGAGGRVPGGDRDTLLTARQRCCNAGSGYRGITRNPPQLTSSPMALATSAME
ncbi:MAG: MFS transporter [Proteobacteria bacterium]|nr:MFS transporter [Pseudomonadota bacterium]